MRFVVDANIIFSALIKDGVTANILFKNNHSFYVPEFIFDEIKKYEFDIIKKTKRSHTELYGIFQKLFDAITIVPEQVFIDKISFANSICPDPNDVLYFALALHLKCLLWSNDKALKDQDVIRVFSTQDLLKQSSSFHEGY